VGSRASLHTFGKEKTLLPLLGIDEQFISYTGHSLVIILTMLTQLSEPVIHAQKSLASRQKNSISQGQVQSRTHSHTHLYSVNSCHSHATSNFSSGCDLDKHCSFQDYKSCSW
jgi:hypothetical protein